MSPDLVFLVCNYAVMPAWLLLAFAPHWKATQQLVHAVWIPLLLGAVFTPCMDDELALGRELLRFRLFASRKVQVLYGTSELCARWLATSIATAALGRWVVVSDLTASALATDDLLSSP